MLGESVDNTPEVRAALQAHADRIVPGGVEQLAGIMAKDLKGLTPDQVNDLVKLRLDRPEYAHFRKPADVVPPGADARPDTMGRLPAAAAQMKAHIATQLDGAPGLAGRYGR